MPELTELEVIPSNSLEAITRGEIDIQIATAHKFPRSMKRFKDTALAMATLDEETAASCLYSRPVGGGKFAEGMSIRMAEIVGASYGNLRVGAMIISQTERQVVCRGFAHDLESNFASTSEVVEATIKKDGKPYDERMRVVIAKACLAKARRDATFQVVPKALCKPVEAEARKVAIGDASTIAKRRGAVIAWIEKLGIDKARVWKALNIPGEDDLGLEELSTLTGLKTAIKDGEVSIDEAFPNVSVVGAPPAVAKPPVAEKKPDPKPAPKATLAEGMVNLCKASGVGDVALIHYMIEQGVIERADSLSDVPDDVLKTVKENWPAVIKALTGNAAEGEQPTQPENESQEHTDAIPTDPGELVKYVAAKASSLDLDMQQVVDWIRIHKHAGANVKKAEMVPNSGWQWAAKNIDASKDEISNL